MGRVLIPVICLLPILALCGCDAGIETIQAGDVVFQDLNTSQSMAIKLATGSEYTHCGLVVDIDGQLMVCEAVGPVRHSGGPCRFRVELSESNGYIVPGRQNDSG